MPLVPPPDESEHDDDDELGGEEDDGPGDHARLVQAVGLVDGGNVIQELVLHVLVVRVHLSRGQLGQLVLLPLAVFIHNLQGLDHEHLLGVGGPLGPGEAHQGGSLLPSERVDSLGLAGVVQHVALDGLALGEAGGDQGPELDHVRSREAKRIEVAV